MRNVKYIDNNPEKGIKYDWKAITRQLKKLKIPPGVYNPADYPFESGCHYYVAMSERGVGKSTQWLLIGLIMFWMYGTHTVYVRQFRDMIAPKNTRDMFGLINASGYIDTLTKGQYNCAIYKAKRWYLAHINDDGDIDKKSTDWFMLQVSVDDGINLKSTINDPVADLIIFDEFISSRIPANDEFPMFCDLVSTFIRTRVSPIIVLLTNTIDREAAMWHELEIHKHIREMHKGDKRLVKTDLGTHIYIDFISLVEVTAKKQRSNLFYFGFRNPKIAAITGLDDWNIVCFPHIPQTLCNESIPLKIPLYIKYYGNLYRLDGYVNEVQGLFVCIHPATKTYDDSFILTLDDFDLTDRKRLYIYGFGGKSVLAPILAKYLVAYERNMWFYDSNDTGSAIKSYMVNVKMSVGKLR